jgi:hypothetical protein
MTVMSGIGRSAAQECLQRPLPSGDPAGVRGLAAQAGGVAGELRRVCDRLRVVVQPGAAADQIWSGPAQRGFAQSIQAKLPSLGTAGARYEAYCTALLGYAVALELAQPRLTDLRRQLVEGCAGSGPADPSGESRLLQLAYRFEQAWLEWDTALRRCNHALSQASSIDRDRHRHGLASFAHGVGRVLSVVSPLEPLIEHPGLAGLSQAWSKLSTEFAVAGLVLLVVCPPAAGACFAAAAVMSAAQLATDLVRTGRHQSGAGIGLLGLDALGALPGGKFVREGEQGVRAIEAVRGSRLVPGGGLAAHEAAGGHTLAKHVGRTAEQLQQRLVDDPTIRRSSSFYDRPAAENAVSDMLARHDKQIQNWLQTDSTGLTLRGRGGQLIGLTLKRGQSDADEVNGVLVHLRRDTEMSIGYHIHTAFPRP